MNFNLFYIYRKLSESVETSSSKARKVNNTKSKQETGLPFMDDNAPPDQDKKVNEKPETCKLFLIIIYVVYICMKKIAWLFSAANNPLFLI